MPEIPNQPLDAPSTLAQQGDGELHSYQSEGIESAADRAHTAVVAEHVDRQPLDRRSNTDLPIHQIADTVLRRAGVTVDSRTLEGAEPFRDEEGRPSIALQDPEGKTDIFVTASNHCRPYGNPRDLHRIGHPDLTLRGLIQHCEGRYDVADNDDRLGRPRQVVLRTVTSPEGTNTVMHRLGMTPGVDTYKITRDTTSPLFEGGPEFTVGTYIEGLSKMVVKTAGTQYPHTVIHDLAPYSHQNSRLAMPPDIARRIGLGTASSLVERYGERIHEPKEMRPPKVTGFMDAIEYTDTITRPIFEGVVSTQAYSLGVDQAIEEVRSATAVDSSRIRNPWTFENSSSTMLLIPLGVVDGQLATDEMSAALTSVSRAIAVNVAKICLKVEGLPEAQRPAHDSDEAQRQRTQKWEAIINEFDKPYAPGVTVEI